MARLLLIALFLATGLGLHGCTSELDPRLRTRLNAYVSEDPPPRGVEIEECFDGGAICLMGYTAERHRGRLELELVYRISAAPRSRLMPITRLIAASPKGALKTLAINETSDTGEVGELLLEDASRQGLVRELHPPGDWAAGSWVRERLSIALPSGAERALEISSEEVLLLELGFAQKTGRLARLLESTSAREETIRLEVSEALRLSAESSRAAEGQGAHRERAREKRLRPPARPRIVARRTSSPPLIDGKLDEAIWERATPFTEFRHPMTGLETRATGSVRVLFDDEALYFGAFIEDHDLDSAFRERDAPLWEADVFEIFLMPVNGASDYLELQISPRGTVFDSHFERHRQPAPHGYIEFDAELELRVFARGTLGDRRSDEGYQIEARLPFRAIEARLGAFKPPAAGSELRVNFFILDRGRGYRSAAAASPPLVPDFHYTPAFARLTFLD